MIGHVAGIAITISAVGALAAARLLSPRHVPGSFDLVVVASIASGIAYMVIPWDRVAVGWLHVIPVSGTVLTAIGIRVGHLDPGVANYYYLLMGGFAGFVFATRWEVAAEVGLAAVASSLPLLYVNQPGGEAPARTMVGILVLVVISGIITTLREALQRRQHELEELTVLDPLTGVGNYRLLAERLDYELARHRRSGGALTVMLLDLDGFKQINDTFGHLAGDRVLVGVARAVSSALRAHDTLARQGGDEFSVLAPGTTSAQAVGLARRIEEAVRRASPEPVTTSVGWATCPADGRDARTLLALADADLRRAKREPRGAEQPPSGVDVATTAP